HAHIMLTTRAIGPAGFSGKVRDWNDRALAETWRASWADFYRLGSGTQYIKDSNGQLTKMGGAYSWLTGGTVGSLSSYQNGEMISTSS
ncbi:hypothetical protein O5161_26555, partial [Escherichia coli]|nr:hypothetical protein [Escherichia coli]